MRKVRAIYAGLAMEVDHHLGRVFAALRDSGRWDDTVVVFTADHGEQLFDHWMLGKTGYFDQSAHIPLIIRDPRPASNAGRGQSVRAFTESIDVMPTLSGARRARRAAELRRGEPAAFLRRTAPATWRDEAHWSLDFRDIRSKRFERLFGLPSDWCNLQVVRTEKLKYVHFAGQPPVLFDLVEDPDELVNRADDPGARACGSRGSTA